MPTSHSFGTYWLSHSWRDSSLVRVLMPQRIDGSSSRGDVGAEEVQDRRPPAVDRLLEHRELLVGAGREREQDVLAVAVVERLLGDDPLHDADVRRVGGLEQGPLGDDRGAVDQEADAGDVAPGVGRVVEDVVELALARRSGPRTSAWRGLPSVSATR